MVVLITGASGGFGAVLAELLAAEGLSVYGTCRNPGTRERSAAFPMLAMEATDESSVGKCIAEVLEREGRIDVVVNCVNEMMIGLVEEQTADEVKAHGYNLDIKNPHTVDDDHGNPEELLKKLTVAEAETASLRDQLKATLGEALTR